MTARRLPVALLVFAALLCGVAAVARAEATVSELVEMLASEDSPSRVRALNELRNRKDPKAIPLLVDRVPTMNQSGQYYGILILDTYAEKQLRKPLRRLLKCESPYVRLCAAEMLHTRGANGMPGAIEKELTAEGLPRDQWKRMMVRLRYGRLPADKGLVTMLERGLVVEGDAEIIRETAYVLDDAGAAITNPTFEALLEDSRPGVRAVAAAFLRARGQDRDGDLVTAIGAGEIPSSDIYFVQDVLTGTGARAPGPEVVDALLAATSTTANSSNLRALVQLLGRLGDKRALPRLRELSRHDSSFVAKAAADAVAELSGTKPATGSTPTTADAADTTAITKMLTKRDRAGLAAWLADEKASRRLSAADALRRLDDLRGLQKVLDEVDCENAVHRRSAVKILGNFRVREGVDPLITATMDDDSTVRSYARSALQTTLQTLFPQRRFGITSRGGGMDTEAGRKRDAELLRAWWKSAAKAPW